MIEHAVYSELLMIQQDCCVPRTKSLARHTGHRPTSDDGLCTGDGRRSKAESHEQGASDRMYVRVQLLLHIVRGSLRKEARASGTAWG